MKIMSSDHADCDAATAMHDSTAAIRRDKFSKKKIQSRSEDLVLKPAAVKKRKRVKLPDEFKNAVKFKASFERLPHNPNLDLNVLFVNSSLPKLVHSCDEPKPFEQHESTDFLEGEKNDKFSGALKSADISNTLSEMFSECFQIDKQSHKESHTINQLNSKEIQQDDDGLTGKFEEEASIHGDAVNLHSIENWSDSNALTKILPSLARHGSLQNGVHEGCSQKIDKDHAAKCDNFVSIEDLNLEIPSFLELLSSQEDIIRTNTPVVTEKLEKEVISGTSKIKATAENCNLTSIKKITEIPEVADFMWGNFLSKSNPEGELCEKPAHFGDNHDENCAGKTFVTNQNKRRTFNDGIYPESHILPASYKDTSKNKTVLKNHDEASKANCQSRQNKAFEDVMTISDCDSTLYATASENLSSLLDDSENDVQYIQSEDLVLRHVVEKSKRFELPDEYVRSSCSLITQKESTFTSIDISSTSSSSSDELESKNFKIAEKINFALNTDDINKGKYLSDFKKVSQDDSKSEESTSASQYSMTTDRKLDQMESSLKSTLDHLSSLNVILSRKLASTFVKTVKTRKGFTNESKTSLSDEDKDPNSKRSKGKNAFLAESSCQTLNETQSLDNSFSKLPNNDCCHFCTLWTKIVRSYQAIEYTVRNDSFKTIVVRLHRKLTKDYLKQAYKYICLISGKFRFKIDREDGSSAVLDFSPSSDQQQQRGGLIELRPYVDEKVFHMCAHFVVFMVQTPAIGLFLENVVSRINDLN